MRRELLVELIDIIKSNRQIILLSGPRQSGKTTLAREVLLKLNCKNNYLNWDDIAHRELILRGTDAIVEELGLNKLADTPPLLVFDELHKYSGWKNFIKGFFDRYENQIKFMVTGSARLDIYRSGGDSLMGRYFHYRLHPLSIRELSFPINHNQLVQEPLEIDNSILDQLLQFGGFPEPLLKQNKRFSNRWQKLRSAQLLQEDIRDTRHVHEIQQLQLLTQLLVNQASKETKYSSLAKSLRVSVDTVRRWLDILESFYFCYRIRPWHQNISTALRKEPRTYLWDWSLVQNSGSRLENFVASHLLKATQWWTDLGEGEFGLFYLRTKDGKEVDFLVTQDNKPWFLVEVKNSEKAKLNPHLKWFQEKTNAQHAFQVYFEGEQVVADCFKQHKPVKVSVLSLLGQLV